MARRERENPADIPNVRVPARGPTNLDVSTYGLPGDRDDAWAVMELGGMQYGRQDQISPATARAKQEIPHLDVRQNQLGAPPAFSSIGKKKPS